MAKRVLVVDDSILMRRMIKDALSHIGLEVSGEAANGEEAVRVYKDTRPDVVTMDIVMPGTDGMYAPTPGSWWSAP
jgi:two-component system chemotaxis response regulator CheY